MLTFLKVISVPRKASIQSYGNFYLSSLDAVQENVWVNVLLKVLLWLISHRLTKPRGDFRENNSAAYMFRCGHRLFNQQGTINIQMLSYILMVTVCAGKERAFRSRQLSKEMEHRDCNSTRCIKLTGRCPLNTNASTISPKMTLLGPISKCPSAVLHLCS